MEKIRHINITFKQHLTISIFLRIALIVYGEIHDQHSEVPYTDVDYKVVTDGARHILDNGSPFQRHTYRYSPLLAILLIPNLLLHQSFGKILFALFDILAGVLIQKTIRNEIKSSFFKCKSPTHLPAILLPERYEKWAKFGALFWLYNPLTMTISTRGNGDAVSSFFVLATIYFLQKFNSQGKHALCAGFCHGIAIHLRIYPAIFSLAYFLSLSDRNVNTLPNFMRQIFKPNKKQILLIFGTILSFTLVTGYFYILYDWEYIYEAYLYHFIRKDTRHNFSLYFLMQYLNTDEPATLVEKILINLPQIGILIYLSLAFGRSMRTLSFCIFGQTFIIVTYNSVITSQYFVWYLALLPLCLKNLRNIPTRLAIIYFCLWLLAQALWLLPAYLLEFKTFNTFNFIGIQSVAFFFVNIFIMQRLIYYFNVFSRVK